MIVYMITLEMERKKERHVHVYVHVCISQCVYLTLAKLVDFPTPLTPQKVTTYGRPSTSACLALCRISIRCLGERICTNDSSILPLMTDCIPVIKNTCTMYM